MEEIKKLNTSICDLSYKEGLEEIIAELKTVQIDTLLDRIIKRTKTAHGKLFTLLRS